MHIQVLFISLFTRKLNEVCFFTVHAHMLLYQWHNVRSVWPLVPPAPLHTIPILLPVVPLSIRQWLHHRMANVTYVSRTIAPAETDCLILHQGNNIGIVWWTRGYQSVCKPCLLNPISILSHCLISYAQHDNCCLKTPFKFLMMELAENSHIISHYVVYNNIKHLF